MSIQAIRGTCLVALMSAAPFAHAQPAAPAAQAEIVPLTADVKSSVTLGVPVSRGQNQVFEGRYFRSRDGRLREDSALGSVIVDVRAQTVTLLNPQRKEATVVHMTGATAARATAPRPAMAVVGETTVEGHPVVKQAKQQTETWIATDLELPVFSRTTAADRTTTKELRNIQVGDPDPAVFAIPKDYKVIVQSAPPPAPPGR